MQLTHRIENNIYVLLLAGEIKEGVRQQIEKYVGNSFQDPLLRGVVFNLEGVPKANSAGVGAIMEIFNVLQEQQKPLVLCHLNGNLSKIFITTLLGKIIPSYETEREALTSFKTL